MEFFFSRWVNWRCSAPDYISISGIIKLYWAHFCKWVFFFTIELIVPKFIILERICNTDATTRIQQSFRQLKMDKDTCLCLFFAFYLLSNLISEYNWQIKPAAIPVEIESTKITQNKSYNIPMHAWRDIPLFSLFLSPGTTAW